MKMLFKKLWVYLKPFLNFKFLICFGIAWIITNGWSYILFALGITLNIKWAITVSSAYIAFLYFPFTAEKLITIPIALGFHHLFFKNDIKTKEQLLELKRQAKEDWHSTKMWFRNIYCYKRFKEDKIGGKWGKSLLK